MLSHVPSPTYNDAELYVLLPGGDSPPAGGGAAF